MDVSNPLADAVVLDAHVVWEEVQQLITPEDVDADVEQEAADADAISSGLS